MSAIEYFANQMTIWMLETVKAEEE